MTEIRSLSELLRAMETGEVSNVEAYVDNDEVVFYGGGRGEDELLALHPYEVQMQALAVLGIKAEPV